MPPSPPPPQRRPWRVVPLMGVLLLLLLARAPGTAVPDKTAPLRTTHYELRSEGPRAEAEEWGRVLEGAWPKFKAFFEAEPPLARDARLVVSVHETAEGWSEAIRAAGGTPPGSAAGGYYDPSSRGAFLYRQPTAWYTRTLLLHEASHQFHYLARTGNRAPAASWYIEGLAEHLSHHTWDGATLRLGVVPPLSLENRAGKALETVRAPAFDIERLVGGESSERPEAMHLVRFLVDGDSGAWRERFETLAGKLDRGAMTRGIFGRVMGPPERLLEAWRAWLPLVQEPLAPVHLDWDARGARAVRGTSTGVSVCRVRGRATGVSANLRPPEQGRWAAGLLLHLTDLNDFTVALVSPYGFKVQRFQHGQWQYLPALLPMRPLEGEPYRFEGLRDGTHVTLRVNGAEVALALHTPALPADPPARGGRPL